MTKRQLLIRNLLLEKRRFEWGTWDCCQFARICVQQITGEDFGEAIPSYDSEAGAAAIIKDFGGIEEMVTTLTGIKPTDNLRDLNDGDPVLMGLPRVGEAIGIRCRKGAFALMNERSERATIVPNSYIHKGWPLCPVR